MSDMSTTPLSVYDMVREFHEAYGVPVGIPFNSKDLYLRDKLIAEEYDEVYEEMFPIDIVPTDRGNLEVECPPDKMKLTKELADLMYVVIGTAVTFGLPLQKVFAAVHQSNMSKLDENGKPIYREDGKVLKGPNYKPPQLEQFFA